MAKNTVIARAEGPKQSQSPPEIASSLTSFAPRNDEKDKLQHSLTAVLMTNIKAQNPKFCHLNFVICHFTGVSFFLEYILYPA